MRCARGLEVVGSEGSGGNKVVEGKKGHEGVITDSGGDGWGARGRASRVLGDKEEEGMAGRKGGWQWRNGVGVEARRERYGRQWCLRHCRLECRATDG